MFIGTHSGKLVNPLNLKPEDILLEDIAHSLALQNRYNGHTRVPYSVAQHSCILCAYCQKHYPGNFHLSRWALLHDAAEAYIGDIPSPIKYQLRLGEETITELEWRIQLVIQNRFNVHPNPEEEAMVEELDKNILINESQEFRHPVLRLFGKELDVVLQPISWDSAKERFLTYARRMNVV